MTRPYRSIRRKTAAAETRRAVLAAALELFEQRGYVAATLAEIAAHAEVAVNTVYTSVGGKPQLLIELVREASANPRIEATMTKIRAARSGRAVITALAHGTSGVFKEHSWLLGALYDNAGTDPLLSDAITSAETAYADRLTEAATRLATLGANALDIPTTSDILWFYFAFRPWRDLRGRGWSWDRIRDWLGDQAGRAVLTDA